ncbi:hypothetical protein A6770_23415 [Nostoc minutum NIES-26]|uniref:Putative restriction endonuclease domain-containing protein n=1 Tax=Nostoc minutum NIES-26 TaxID=1844469 RepID=A0A367QZC4_9NOSO|nr:hypothetical protein A6770_23415 [Nostoc minutum NIES-26]
MTQALPKIVTFDEFIAWYPENSGIRYELHNGEIVEMSQPTGKHEGSIPLFCMSLRAKRSEAKQSQNLQLRASPCDCFVVPPRNDSYYLIAK